MEEEVKLTKKERREQKKAEKKARRQADKEFERNAGRKAPKILSLIFGIIGFLIGFIPVILIILAFIFMILCGLLTAILAIVWIMGLICFGLGYLIYASQVSNPSLDGYFAPVMAPVDFSSAIFNGLVNINGILTTIFASAGLFVELVALTLLFVSYKALVKRHIIAYTILLGVGIVITIVVLVWGITSI